MSEYPFENAVWIGVSSPRRTPIIVKNFTVENFNCAEIYITGLGYFYPIINDEPITDEYFLPLVSNYEEIDRSHFVYPSYDKLTHRIYYHKYDISAFIKKGKNRLTVELGNGFYRQHLKINEGDASCSDNLKTVFSIKIYSGDRTVEINSDGSEMYYLGNIVSNNIYTGEKADYTLALEECLPIEIMPQTDSILTEAEGISDRIIRTITPTQYLERNNKRYFDVGENISGVVKVMIDNPIGEKTVLRFAERIDENGELDFDSSGGFIELSNGEKQIMCDEIISGGERQIYIPKFVWHSFRYFEVLGNFEALEVLVIHSDTSVVSNFESSSEGLNYLYEAFLRTQLNNMHGGYPSDCPHRERLGYTGDGQTCAQAGMLMLDSKSFYRKWIRDIFDSQDRNGGHIQHTAPFFGGGGGPGGWGGAAILVPYYYYKHYGDLYVLKDNYIGMSRLIDYYTDRCENGLLVREDEGGWCLGDWCTLGAVEIPPPLVNSYFFAKCLKIMSSISALIGFEQDSKKYEDKFKEVLYAIDKAYKGSDGHYASGVQGADAYASDIGLDRNITAEYCKERYDSLGHFDTGFLGTGILLKVLFENGYADSAYELLESRELGSFLYMKDHGATTLWENWDGSESQNHPMFGGCSSIIFDYILGIGQTARSAGYSDIVISPKIPSKMKYAKGSITTPYGKISVSWERCDDFIEFCISVPCGVKAKFEFNGTEMHLENLNRIRVSALKLR